MSHDDTICVIMWNLYILFIPVNLYIFAIFETTKWVYTTGT